MSARTREHGAWEAWNQCLSHLVELANAHIERVIFKAYLDKIAKETDPNVRKVPHRAMHRASLTYIY